MLPIFIMIKDYLTLHHSSTSQIPLNPYAKTFAPHTLSIRMNVGRKGTSYLQRIATYLPFSDPKKLPYLSQPAGRLFNPEVESECNIFYSKIESSN